MSARARAQELVDRVRRHLLTVRPRGRRRPPCSWNALAGATVGARPARLKAPWEYRLRWLVGSHLRPVAGPRSAMPVPTSSAGTGMAMRSHCTVRTATEHSRWPTASRTPHGGAPSKATHSAGSLGESEAAPMTAKRSLSGRPQRETQHMQHLKRTVSRSPRRTQRAQTKGVTRARRGCGMC